MAAWRFPSALGSARAGPACDRIAFAEKSALRGGSRGDYSDMGPDRNRETVVAQDPRKYGAHRGTRLILLAAAGVLLAPIVAAADDPPTSRPATEDKPEDTPEYRRLAARAAENEARYLEWFKTRRRADEQAILSDSVRYAFIREYVVQNRALGDQARSIQLYFRLPLQSKSRRRMSGLCRSDLLDAKQFSEVLRMTGGVWGEFDPSRLPDRPSFEGGCGNLWLSYADHGTYFEVFLALGRQEEATTLARKLFTSGLHGGGEVEWAASGFTKGLFRRFGGIKDAAFWTALVKGAVAAERTDVAEHLFERAAATLSAAELNPLREALDASNPPSEKQRKPRIPASVEDKDQ